MKESRNARNVAGYSTIIPKTAGGNGAACKPAEAQPKHLNGITGIRITSIMSSIMYPVAIHPMTGHQAVK